MKGQAIGVSDGSVITVDNESYGGHSYSLQSWHTDEYQIYGEVPTPHSTKISSLTTELYGLIATTLLVYILQKKYDVHQMLSVNTTITADNDQAIKMGNEWNTPLNISETNTQDYDLWTLLWQLRQASTVNITYKWIKGHQDQLKTGGKIFGPFSREVQLNIQMDALAKIASDQSSKSPVLRPTNSTTAMGLYTLNNIFISDIHDFFQYVMTEKPMIDYLI